MSYNPTDLVEAKVLDKMFRRFADLFSRQSAIRPHKDPDTGRYDNLDVWMRSFSDGKVYGVKYPLYDYSPATTATKTGSNAGLVLEASTDTVAGANDYEAKMLFMCPRVNGGVDTDGTHYVTAIEGYDNDFDETENTYTLTPAYYRRVSRDSQYETLEITDTPRTGFKACRGAYTSAGVARPFILRACFMDADGNFSSKSGTMPAAHSSAYPTSVNHSQNSDFSASKSRASTDGLTYLDYGDIEYQHDFMMVMLGVKAPRSVAVGCVSYNVSATVSTAESAVKRVVLANADADMFLVGSTINVGDGTSVDRGSADSGNIAKCATIVSKTAVDASNTALNLDLASAVNIAAGSKIVTMPWKNGCCDGVLGTFGSKSAAGLTNGKEPFKFQNVEWQLGLYEDVFNLISAAVVADGVATHTWWIAPDCSDCTGSVKGTGWEQLEQTTFGAINAWQSIKDYTTEKGAPIPENVNGTTSTGYMTSWYPSSSSGDRETLVGGRLIGGSVAGVGCCLSAIGVSSPVWDVGGRSSGIGHSAPAE